MLNRDLQSELARMLEIIRMDSSVERVILFGSTARQEGGHRESDLDLCIVQDTGLRFYDRLAEWIDRIQPRVGLDLVVYTPHEFATMREGNHFVRREIAEKGLEIYAA